MTVLKLKISDDNLDELVNYLIQELSFDYECHSQDMSILMADSFYPIKIQAQVNMMFFKRDTSFILTDIIGAGGGDGILNLDWGTEKGYTKTAAKAIHQYAAENSFI